MVEDGLAHGRRDLRGVQGHGNAEIVLDRKLTDKRVFPPSTSTAAARARKELLIPKDELNRTYILRRS